MKLYVLIRNDLSISQQAVQSGHVVAKFASKRPDINWDKQIFVYLKVSPFQIKKYLHRLSFDGVYHEIFKEPDIDNQITSIAILGECDSFKGLNLL